MSAGGLTAAVRECLGDIEPFSRYVIRRPLYPHQLEAARGIAPYIEEKIKNPQFSVIMARQSGKNELSAHLTGWLMNRYQKRGGVMVLVAPTAKPQVITSMQRLESVLSNWWNQGQWSKAFGYIIRLGNASVQFFSADPQSNVVGATASIMQSFDEAQDILEFKLRKDFLPMAATTNAPRVYYGTAWTPYTVLEQVKAENLEYEKSDGIRRHFEYPWEVLAEINPDYRAFVEGEIARMGIDHPIIKTQYRLIPIDSEGRFLSEIQLNMIDSGQYARWKGPERRGFDYVMGIDFAGESEFGEGDMLRQAMPHKDSTVVSIARLDRSTVTDENQVPTIDIVDHYWWTGENITTQYANIANLIQRWNPVRVVCDATGVGAGVTGFLRARFGTVIEPFMFNVSSKSDLGFGLLAAVNTGHLHVYHEESPSTELNEFWFELANAVQTVRENQKINFYVPDTIGHDDFLISTALCVRAGERAPRMVTSGSAEIFARGKR